jgi:lycopene beta-cyclase
VREADYDIIFVGAGLSGGLAAYRLRQLQPQLRILLVDEPRAATYEQTWSFQGLAEPPKGPWGQALYRPQSSWLAPLLTRSWESYDVRFPRRQRHLNLSYHSLRYQDFKAHLRATFGADFLEGRVLRFHARAVSLADGRSWQANCVIDARGWPAEELEDVGYQKFVGLNLELKEAHGLDRPILKDACVPQTDGYRFFYVLPWTSHSLLIEDTHYSLNPSLDVNDYEHEIRSYAKARGWQIKTEISREQGVLPIPLWGLEAPRPSLDWPRIGAGAGLFHAVTGYSIYEAVCTAEWLASQTSFQVGPLTVACTIRAQDVWRQQGFLRRLNNMLFYAALPDRRYTVLERFYSHPEALIARFYMGTLRVRDKLRILTGKPPVPVHKGLYYFFHKFGVTHGTAQKLAAVKDSP